MSLLPYLARLDTQGYLGFRKHAGRTSERPPLKPGKTASELYDAYTQFGRDPFIVCLKPDDERSILRGLCGRTQLRRNVPARTVSSNQAQQYPIIRA
jgi:hypothetical protein